MNWTEIDKGICLLKSRMGPMSFFEWVNLFSWHNERIEEMERDFGKYYGHVTFAQLNPIKKVDLSTLSEENKRLLDIWEAAFQADQKLAKIKMENGYYKPDVGEICSRLEVLLQSIDDASWGKYVVSEINSAHDFAEDIEAGRCFVKLLDRADIEAEGFDWRYADDDPAGFVTKHERLVFSKSVPDKRNPGRTLLVRCFYVPATNWMIIDSKRRIEEINLFVGRIRNKTEFNKLLKQIGI